MIQDIYPHQFKNEYQANLICGDDDYVLHYKERTILMKSVGEDLYFPRRKDFSEINDSTEVIFLFRLNNEPYFLIQDELTQYDECISFEDVNFFRYTKQREIGFLTTVGIHLDNWYAENQFCGKCASKMQHKSDERAMRCDVCAHVVYPKISPAIIVAIFCKDKLLLAHNANFPADWYSLVAGYVDVGENVEDTVRREVKEEVGLDVKNIRYDASQPWSLSGSLMIGCIAEADDQQPIQVDGKEIEHADWYTRNNLPAYPPNASIAGEIIEKFKNGEL